MNLRIVFFVVGVLLAATVLLFAGGVAEVELLTDNQCGASYLCDPPTADAGHAPVERGVAAR
jgi:3-keto-L-gulonate-6-phosphate decarboxylase